VRVRTANLLELDTRMNFLRRVLWKL